jgi:hypothetical protein
MGIHGFLFARMLGSGHSRGSGTGVSLCKKKSTDR